MAEKTDKKIQNVPKSIDAEKGKAEETAKVDKAAVAPAPAAVAPAPAAEEKKTEKKVQVKRPAKKISLVLGEQLLFNKYSVKDVVVNDPSAANYILLNVHSNPNTYGRRKSKAYLLSHMSIVERLVNKLMRGGTGQKISGRVIRTKGRLQGKKQKVIKIVEEAFAMIEKKTGKNPVQVLVNALENTAPIEDTTRIRYGGINYNVAVGISASRRLDVALRHVAIAALIGAFKNTKSLASALADELVFAANKDPSSYAIKKKVEMERIAKSAR